MKSLFTFVWLLIAALGAYGYWVIAFTRGEQVNSAYILIAALCTYAIGYRFYSKWIAAKVLALDDRRATPCEAHEDGKDFVRTNRWIVFGHHFAAISGPGPLVGPVLAAQFGYLPGTLWILIGVVLGGAIQDFVILVASMRRDGRSLAQMVRDELNSSVGALALIAILSIMIILLAVLALVVVNLLGESPWGVFTVSATLPIALLMGTSLRFWRVGKVLEVSVVGVVLLLLAVWGGQFVQGHAEWSARLTFSKLAIAETIIVYGFAASVLPVWLLLAPRDYLSTFMKLGTILSLAIGVLIVLPNLKMPPISRFVDGSGLVAPGTVFPFCFITIACGAISGFHTLISSGITPKIITRERHCRSIGYGAMLLESLVAIMAMIAACTLDPGVYLSMNVAGPKADVVRKVEASGLTWFDKDPERPGRFRETPVRVSVEQMDALALEMGETTLFGRTGGAATLAVGMAQIFARITQGRWLDLWYHFAVMFEALFILTTLDAGTRVGRYLLQDSLGHLWKPLGSTRRLGPNLLASLLVVGGWGFFLIAGVRDPDGGVKALWPIFGIANQLLASIALCLATTVLLKTHLGGGQQDTGPARLRPAFALITLVPLVWLLAVTVTAGWEKIFHDDPRIGFVAAARGLEAKLPGLEKALESARSGGDASTIQAATLALKNARTLLFNSRVDIVITGAFLILVVIVMFLAVLEWSRLLRGRRPPAMRETEVLWLPNAPPLDGRPAAIAGLVAIGCGLARELSGEAAVDRAEAANVPVLECRPAGLSGEKEHAIDCRRRAYLIVLEEKYSKINRCC
ncbi:MAG: carbon starvation protein A [Verrucomicrobia bacterium]|nr:carbon starvation protein A [Verrucomicrobiota bacterium]